MAAACSPIGCSVEETICELDDMDSELDSGGENPVDIENLIWFSSQISPQNWSPFCYAIPVAGCEHRRCEGSINQGWTTAMQNPSPRRTQHKMLENAPEMCAGQIAMNPVGSVNPINEENTKHDSPAKVPWYMCKALPTPAVNAQDLFA